MLWVGSYRLKSWKIARYALSSVPKFPRVYTHCVPWHSSWQAQNRCRPTMEMTKMTKASMPIRATTASSVAKACDSVRRTVSDRRMSLPSRIARAARRMRARRMS